MKVILENNTLKIIRIKIRVSQTFLQMTPFKEIKKVMAPSTKLLINYHR